jgi:hypothetical protein
MEKQMRAEREKRAAILTAEGVRQSKILTAEGEKQSAILTAEGLRQAKILTAQGEAQAIAEVFQAVHDNDADPKLLAYQYLQTLPQIAQGAGSTFWVIPSEVTSALKSVAGAFGGDAAAAPLGPSRVRREPPAVPAADGTPVIAPAPAADAVPEIASSANGDSTPEATRAASPSAAGSADPDQTIPDLTDSVSAMLAAAIPGASFSDPLGGVDSVTPAADIPAPAPVQDVDLPTANGSEPAS